MKSQISTFESLPDEARVSAETFSVLLDVHLNTVWRRAKNDPTFPKPIKLGNRCTRFRVGDIRVFMSGVAA
ncbi:MAG: AlpA family phage regulatory protein [Hydrogenophaga sp.]|nr:AlpA family phage regulatory protein [Hydrogenophaga sp.]